LAHGVTGVASLILLPDINDQRIWTLHFYFEGGDQRVFCVNNNAPRLSLKFEAGRYNSVRSVIP